MIPVYGVLVIGGISSYLNYKLQSRWYKETAHERETIDQKIDRLLSTKMPRHEGVE